MRDKVRDRIRIERGRIRERHGKYKTGTVNNIPGVS